MKVAVRRRKKNNSEFSKYLFFKGKIQFRMCNIFCEEIKILPRKFHFLTHGLGRGMWHAWERGETCTGYWWESPRERGHLKDQGVDGRMGSEWTLGRLVGGCGVDSPGSG
jgi:hypothetical protein